MADKFDMGEMPEAPESDELDLEGMDYDTPEEEASPLDELKSKVSGLGTDELKELEAAIADELAKKEEGLDEEVEETEDEVMEDEEGESGMGGLGAMFS